MTTSPSHLVMATNNAHKLDELRNLLASDDSVEVLALADLPAYPEPAETEPTFEGNSVLKAMECARRTGLPALADDSGLEVDALNGMPGVLSARWSGGHGSDAANRKLLLDQMSAVPVERRTARFVCTMAFVVPDGGGEPRVVKQIRCTWPGRILTQASTPDGFGYDPLFVADDAPEREGRQLSSAELTTEEKNARSHRGQALRAMLPVLLGTLASPQE